MTHNKKLILRALAGDVTERIPFWLMRQAGRYLPEYREVRQKAGSFLKLCYTPDYAAEVTLQPIRRYGMDAAIIFSDILVTPHALGQTLGFVEGEGPKLDPLTTPDDIKKLTFDAFDKNLAPVFSALERVKKELPDDTALIGFAGAPWTLACYMLQGYGDGEFSAAKKFAYNNPAAFDQLIELLVEATNRYLSRQIASGADVVQIFDSWAGLLPESYFRRWVIEPTQKITEYMRRHHPQTPVIGFPRGAGCMYGAYVSRTGVQGVGIDTHMSLEKAISEFGKDVCIQGNLDPVLLLSGGACFQDEMRRIFDRVQNQPFIFNLGHGIIKETPPDHVTHLRDMIRAVVR